MTHKEKAGKTGRRVHYKNHHPKTNHLARLVFFIFVFFSTSVNAQTSLPIRIGFGGELGSNISQTYIESFAGDFLCGVFQKGSAPGISFFGMAEIPLPLNNFSLIPSIGYRNLSSSFITNPFNIEHTQDVINPDTTAQIFRQRNYTTNVQTISVDALLAWRPFGGFHFATGGGVAILLHHSYTQTEKLLSNYVYTDNLLSTRQVSSGTFDARSFAIMLDLGAGYDISLSRSVTINPEIRASFPLTPISSTNGSDYRTWTIGGVVSLMYALPVDVRAAMSRVTNDLPRRTGHSR